MLVFAISDLLYLYFYYKVIVVQTVRRRGTVAWRYGGELYVQRGCASLLPTRQLVFCSCFWLQQYTATCYRRLYFYLLLLLRCPCVFPGPTEPTL